MAKPEPELYEGRFSGAFDLDDSEVPVVELDGEVFFVVRCRVQGEGLDIHPKTGVVKQISKLKVLEAGVVRTSQLRDTLCDSLGLQRPAPQLQFQDPEPEVDLEETLEEPLLRGSSQDVTPPETETDAEVIRHGPTGGARQNDPMLARFINAS